MNTFSIILIAFAIIVTMGGVINALRKRIKELQEEKRELLDKIGGLNSNVAYLIKHSQELASIQRDQAEIKNKIEEAKDDEEISNIVSAIISANNQRVQNNKTK